MNDRGEKRGRIALAIDAYWREHGYAPSYRELIDAANISSLSVLEYNLTGMKRQGIVDYEKKIARSVRLTDAGKALVG